MELSITSVLAMFILIALSTAVFFTAKKFNLPYTVLLVLVGLLLVPAVNLPYLNNVFGFISDMVLTPELLFYIFLPVLIFESAFNMNIRKILDSAWAISLMSVLSLLISTLVVAFALYAIMPLIGIQIPLIIALIFGALISPTDPVAALSIFKECGVPRRLANIFEGESLLNDGTAMALFFVILGIATNGFYGTETIFNGIVQFSMMVFLGIGFGLFMSAIFSHILRFTKSNEFVTVTLMLISAHIVFILCELINHAGFVHISSIIATAVSALFMGNYYRHILAPSVEGYLGKLIEHMAFVVNSLVFLMAGLLFASSNVQFIELWIPILVTVIIVASARIVSVYSVTIPLKWLKLESPIPSSWEKLLAWGSLRGALSIIIVMLIPEDFSVPGWEYQYSPRDFILALTIGCILATLFIKAPLIKPIMTKLNIREESPLKDAYKADLAIYYLVKEHSQICSYSSKGFLSPEQSKAAIAKVEQRINEAEAYRLELVNKYGINIFKQSLHFAMAQIERMALKQLFLNEEVSEKTFRKIYSRLGGRIDRIEELKSSYDLVNTYTDRKDIFEHFVNFIQMPFDRQKELSHQQKLEYYRAQMIIARKAIKVIEQMQTDFNRHIFLPEVYEDTISLYRRYKERSEIRATKLVSEFKDELSEYLEKLAQRSLEASGRHALEYLTESGLADEHLQEHIRRSWAI